MKPYLYLIIALLITSQAVQAQHANIGIKGGLNGYNIEGDNSAGNELKLSFNLGLLAHLHMGDQFALQPEIVYSGQGTQRKVAGSNVDLNLNYVNIPILIQYMFDNGFRIEAGPQLGILSSAKSVNGNNTTDVKSAYESTDVSIAMGMSYVKPSTGFGFDIRYNYGMTNINDTNASNAYNRGWQIGLFYLFEHKS